jgi:hypothetical protein
MLAAGLLSSVKAQSVSSHAAENEADGGGDDGGGSEAAPSRRLWSMWALALLASSTMSCVALAMTSWWSCADINVGSASSQRAMTPAACGAAIDVPLMTTLETGSRCDADVISEPGAKTSTQSPQLE